MWATPLDHLAENISLELSTIHQQKLAAATNTDAVWYRTEKISFDEALVREKAFSLRSLRKDFEEIAKEILRITRNIVTLANCLNQLLAMQVRGCFHLRRFWQASMPH